MAINENRLYSIKEFLTPDQLEWMQDKYGDTAGLLTVSAVMLKNMGFAEHPYTTLHQLMVHLKRTIEPDALVPRWASEVLVGMQEFS